MNSNVFRKVSFAALLLLAFQFPVYSLPTAEYFPPLSESKAYQNFKRRPSTNFSKIIFLIERFEPTGAEIYYDGLYFKAPFAAWVAKSFLARQYRKESVEEWIMKWCNTSIGGKLIYAKFPDGKYLPAREVLLEEWKALEATTKT